MMVHEQIHILSKQPTITYVQQPNKNVNNINIINNHSQ